MTEETPVSKPKAVSRTRTPKTSSESNPVVKKTSATAVSEKKTPATRSTATKQTAVADSEKPRSTRRKTTVPARPSPEERYRMVQAAAYFIAEKEDFQGNSVDYWLRAEQEIADRLGETAS